MQKIEHYFDYAATTPMLPEVITAIQPYFSQDFANPSSAHQFGQRAFSAVENARETLKQALNLSADDSIIFTGSSTEACNMILHHRVFSAWEQTGKACHVITSPLEHSAVREPLIAMQKWGWCELEFLPVNSCGQVSPDDVKERIRPDTALVSVIYGNNEIGTINPIPEINQICAERDVYFHSDATQFAAHHPLEKNRKFPLTFNIAAHKCYGPKGSGALIYRNVKNDSITPLIYGGKQQNGLRSGTLDVPSIVGLASAFSVFHASHAKRLAHETAARDRIISLVLDQIPDTQLTGHPTERLANHASFAFKNIDSLTLQAVLDQKGFAVSVGSACRSNAIRGQQQLIDLGLNADWASGGLRITAGIYTTDDAIDELVSALTESVAFLRRSGL